jgi:hypothetical protein
MSTTQILLDLINGYKTYSAAILAVFCGVSAILSKNYSDGLTDILQALTLIYGGIAVIGLRHAVSKVPTAVFSEAGKS